MNKGFTLIELVISIFVLSIAVIGVYSVFSAMLILTSDSADRLVAIYLAQEGAEIIRNMRDNAWLANEERDAWLDKIAPPNGPNCTSGCKADFTTDTGVSGAYPLQPWAGGNDNDYLTLAGSFYTYKEVGENIIKTKFKRKIKISLFDDGQRGFLDHAVKVVVEASWDQRATIFRSADLASDCNRSNCITVEYILYNWY